MDKYRNKYRIASARAAFWDYGRQAHYFITICTHGRICWFGHVANGLMILSDIGELVKTEWLRTFDMRPDMNLFMGEYVVMPNHFHAIIGIGDNPYNTGRARDGDGGDVGHRDAMHCVSNNNPTNNDDSVPAGNQPPMNRFGPQSKNLASIVRGFKMGVTKSARAIQPDFAWQSRYHDRIIRDERAFQAISTYIINNPTKWTDDTFNRK